jgi:hypothetical protein
MPILDTISGMSTGTYTVTRRAVGTMTSGKYVPNPTSSTFTIEAVVQPATDLQRVVGGSDLRSYVENQRVDDVRSLHTATELWTRTTAHDPDIITIEGDTWVVFRVERWDFYGDTFFMVVVTRQTQGAS